MGGLGSVGYRYPTVAPTFLLLLFDGVHIAEVGATEGRAGGGGEDEVEGGDEEGGDQEGGAWQGLGTKVLLLQVVRF
jgi:hypothetical protein